MIYVNNFKGAVPRCDPKLLPAGFAQTALNVDLRTGSFKPMAGLGTVTVNGDATGKIPKTGAIQTIHKIDTAWVYWAAIVEVVKAQVLSGGHRIFYTGDGYPKQTNKTLAITGATSGYPAATRRFGVIAPIAGLTMEKRKAGAAAPAPEETDVVTDSVSYVYTYVTAWGEESAFSPETVVMDVYTDQYVRLKGFAIPSLATTGNDIAYFRVYRLASGTTGAEYQMAKMRPGSYGAAAVYDIPIAGAPTDGTYVYDCDSSSSPAALNDSLGTAQVSEDWDVPPATLSGLIQFQNGVIAGFDADQLCVSEPMIYYAMPEDYKQTIPGIVAIGVYNDAMVVGTGDFPHIVIGNDPATLTDRILPYNQACLSKRGLVAMDIGVAYPSPDGLFLVTQTDGTLLTKGIYTKEQWAALTPANLISFFYDDKYYGFFNGTNKGFVFNFKDDPYIQTFEITGVLFYGGYIDPGDDTLYVLVKVGDYYYVKSWGTGSNISGTWKSPVHESADLTNYGWARVSGDYSGGKTISFVLYADGATKLTKTVSSSEFFRLPGGYQARTWEFQISGTAEVDSVFIGHAKEEAP